MVDENELALCQPGREHFRQRGVSWACEDRNEYQSVYSGVDKYLPIPNPIIFNFQIFTWFLLCGRHNSSHWEYTVSEYKEFMAQERKLASQLQITDESEEVFNEKSSKPQSRWEKQNQEGLLKQMMSKQM